MDRQKKTLNISLPTDIFIFWAIFFYALLAGLTIQLLILPYLLPSWNAGQGLLAGLDSVYFHKLAILLAEQIKTQGLSAWVLRPEGQAPAGIAALLYRYIAPCPCVLLPLNALLHAIAGMTLFKIMRRILSNRSQALLAILPFVFFPSAMTWISQIHKDTFYIAGVYLYIYGWVQITDSQAEKRIIWQGISLALIGLSLVWIVREYAVEMLAATSIMLGIFTLPAATRIQKVDLPKPSLRLARTFSLVAVIAAAFLLSSIKIPSFRMQENNAPLPASSEIEPATSAKRVEFEWQPSLLPTSIDQRLRSFAIKRESYRLNYPAAGSNIDVEISLNSVGEILLYSPRALEIGLLAPFPADWFGEGTLAQNTLQRRISGVEMSIAYLSFLLLPFGIYRWQRSATLWYLLFFCLTMILLYSLIVANVGTLYRFRYAFYTPLIGLGLAAFQQFIPQKGN